MYVCTHTYKGKYIIKYIYNVAYNMYYETCINVQRHNFLSQT